MIRILAAGLAAAAIAGCGSSTQQLTVGKGMRMGDGTVRTRPLVVAHRGWSAVAPENTLAAYRKAIEVGAEMAECDVHLSKDGVPVLMHDADLKRTTGRTERVADLTAAELATLDAGSWKSPAYAAERVPTLAQALELVAGRLRFVIEIKDASMASQVARVVRQGPIPAHELMVFSFSREAVAEIARIEPELPTTWLLAERPVDAKQRAEVFRAALRARASALGISHKKVDAAFVRGAHERGFIVFCWTVNEPEDMDHVISLGVDAVITDRPDVLLRRLKAPAVR